MSHGIDVSLTKRQRICRAPGRVNLIGEHTDYNDGFVLPAAINLNTQVTISPREDRKLLIRSASFSDDVEFELDDFHPTATGHWSDYVRGVALTLERAGHRLKGAELNIRSTVPIGAGLSSSAALEVAAGYALLENSGHEVDRLELARVCQQAENEFVGMRCGIMDQFVSCFGQAGHSLMLDCRSLEYRLLPLPVDVRLVICNTMIMHQLAAGEYNKRRNECEAGVQHFARFVPNVRALRDITINDLESYGRDLPEAIFKRCRHVITENARVLNALPALQREDLRTFGDLMTSSHRSLRDDYEVSCPELDTMVDLASKLEGVYGARMTGGGFGGCTINLVTADRVAEFTEDLGGAYEQSTGLVPDIYVCSTADGVAVL
jgi:galactokinase